MNETIFKVCKGCGAPSTIEPVHKVSRYGHGDMCDHCADKESIDGDFIGNDEV